MFADLNRDGRNDLVVRGGDLGSDRLEQAARVQRLGRDLEAHSEVEAGDVTGDRMPDLVCAGYDGKLVYPQRNGGGSAVPSCTAASEGRRRSKWQT